jgi:hypothetical protein
MKAVGKLIAGLRQYEEKEGHENRVKFVLSKFIPSSCTFDYSDIVIRELPCYMMWFS